MLHYLDFDMSEDAHGTAAWDAMASPPSAHNPAMLAEVAALLNRLHAVHGQPGPLDEQHDWDCDLHIQRDNGTLLGWHWLGPHLQWAEPADRTPGTRLTVSLSLSGHTEFTHTLEQEIAAP